MLLLDTDVMVDILRNYAPATEWLRQLGAEEIALPGLVAMELLQGCRDKLEQQQVEAILRQYRLYWPSQLDSSRAYEIFARFRLSAGIGILDALIAETAVGHKLPLATFNEKHYRVIPDLNLVQPYQRV
ncbi:MAG: type II toxin-antitoxin system VapC family toxin [Chloroflexota bacterium]